MLPIQLPKYLLYYTCYIRPNSKCQYLRDHAQRNSCFHHGGLPATPSWLHAVWLLCLPLSARAQLQHVHLHQLQVFAVPAIPPDQRRPDRGLDHHARPPILRRQRRTGRGVRRGRRQLPHFYWRGAVRPMGLPSRATGRRPQG